MSLSSELTAELPPIFVGKEMGDIFKNEMVKLADSKIFNGQFDFHIKSCFYGEILK